jgi:hypothetical protein
LRGSESSGGTEAADAPAPDDEYTDVHIHVWVPWSAFSAVGDAASSVSYRSIAPDGPDCTSTSRRWVREHPSRVLSTLTSPSYKDVRGTSDDDTSGSGLYHLP